jgi:hypothetical protein
VYWVILRVCIPDLYDTTVYEEENKIYNKGLTVTVSKLQGTCRVILRCIPDIRLHDVCYIGHSFHWALDCNILELLAIFVF